MPLLQLQDRDMSFRKVAGSAQVANASIVVAQRVASPNAATSGSLGAIVDPGSSRGLRSPPAGQKIVVFCADNDVTQTAISTVALLARAGRDQVFLVTVVPTAMQQAQGSSLVMRYYQQLSQVLIQVRDEN